MNQFFRSIFYCYGFGWLIGGLIYIIVSMAVPILFSSETSYTPTIASQFMLSLHTGWPYYVLVFTIFTIADTAMMFIGLVFRSVFGASTLTNIATLCLFAGGLVGVCVDLSLLTCWMIMGILKLSPEVLHGFWSVFLTLQYMGTVLSAWGFLMGGIGIYALYQASKPITLLSNGWKKLTLFIFWLCLFILLTIIYSLITNNGIPSDIVFLIFTIIVAPTWSIWSINQLKKWQQAPTTQRSCKSL